MCILKVQGMFVGYFSCLVVLGGNGIDSSALKSMNEMGRLESSLSCSCFLPESSTALLALGVQS